MLGRDLLEAPPQLGHLQVNELSPVAMGAAVLTHHPAGEPVRYPAADLVSRACLRERMRKGRKQPRVLHADNGNAMRAATLEDQLEELGVLRSF